MFQHFIIDIVREGSSRDFNALTNELIFDIFLSKNIDMIMKTLGREVKSYEEYN